MVRNLWAPHNISQTNNNNNNKFISLSLWASYSLCNCATISNNLLLAICASVTKGLATLGNIVQLWKYCREGKCFPQRSQFIDKNMQTFLIPRLFGSRLIIMHMCDPLRKFSHRAAKHFVCFTLIQPSALLWGNITRNNVSATMFPSSKLMINSQYRYM